MKQKNDYLEHANKPIKVLLTVFRTTSVPTGHAARAKRVTKVVRKHKTFSTLTVLYFPKWQLYLKTFKWNSHFDGSARICFREYSKLCRLSFLPIRPVARFSKKMRSVKKSLNWDFGLEPSATVHLKKKLTLHFFLFRWTVADVSKLGSQLNIFKWDTHVDERATVHIEKMFWF